MAQLIEITRRIATTKPGKEQLEYERQVAMMDAYGGMYRSINNGWQFARTYIAVRCELQYNLMEDDEG